MFGSMRRIEGSLAAGFALLVAGVPAKVVAQSATYLNAPSPEKIAVTAGGVDIRTGRHTYTKTDLSAGDGAGAIKFERTMPTPILGHVAPFGNFSHNWDILLVVKPSLNTQYNGYDYLADVSFGGRSQSFEKFYVSGNSQFVQKSQTDATRLTTPGSVGGTNIVYTYRATDGTIAVFRPINTGTCISASYSYQCANVDYIVEPDGTRFNFEYETTGGQTNNVRLRAVTSNRGYALLLEYGAGGGSWNHVSKACVLNLSVTTKPSNNVCPAGALATTSYTYAAGAGQLSLAGATAPDATTDSFAYSTINPFVSYQMSYTKAGQGSPWMTNVLEMGFTAEGAMEPYVKSQSFADGSAFTYYYDQTPATDDGMGQQTSYQTVAGGSYVNALGQWTEVRYDFPAMPNSLTPPRVIGAVGGYPYVNYGDVVLQVTPGPARIVDALGRTTTSDYCDINAIAQGCLVSLLQSTTDPEGNKVKIKYGVNRNPIEIGRVAKAGSGLADTVETAAYDSTACTNYAVTCNRPLSVTDAKGVTTNYTWDSTHAGMLTESKPAPTSGAPAPQKRYSYGQFYAWYRNSAGTLVQAPNPVWLVTQISECRTGSTPSCLNTADEMRTTFTYGTPGTANNLLPTAKTVAAGDGSISATTTWTYDGFGNKLTEDGPLAGSNDTTRWRYDVQRRVVGVVSPDPDGAGTLKHPAVRNTYDAAGRLTKVETGYVNSQLDADWPGFVVVKTAETAFDQLDRKVREWSYGTAGGVQQVTQYSYDLAGRLECTAVRMNPAVFGSLPASACTLGTQGSFGPDRITKLTYDAAGQLLKTTVALGTPDQADDEVKTYTLNGKLATITDGESNRTTYEYDGHDRLVKTRFPVATQGAAASSTTDYESLTYDANDNIATRRKRDGAVFTYQYDTLNRMTLKIVPERSGLSSTHTRDVYYGYDLQDRQLFARFDSASGDGITMAYDALGRPTTETKAMDGTWSLGSGYDLAGNRTAFSFADGQYVWSSYDSLNRPTAIWRSGTYIEVYDYNSAAQRIWRDNANGMRTDYSYDPVGRISSFSNNFYNNPGQGAWNNLYGFGYNPAGQITARSQTNANYAWTAHYNFSRGYTANGLNQYTASGGASLGYDANGNLTSDGSTTFTYDAENRLVVASGAKNATVRYDPLGRLHEVSGASGVTRFVWDGDALVMEYNSSGQLLRRYVHGTDAKADDPLAWYEGAAFDSSTERFLRSDERGSIVTVSTATTMLAANRYDEYGIPQSSNSGRFQYTGQAWIPELGLYHYKARMYSPTLGRFMQTDPIGYEDGINWYAYVQNDPINEIDFDGQESANFAVSGRGPELSAPTIGDVIDVVQVAGVIWDIATLPSGLGSGPEGIAASQAIAGGLRKMAGEAGEQLSKNAVKLSKVEKSVTTRKIGGKFTEKTKVVPGKGPGQSRAEYKTVKNENGKTIRTRKDSYDRANKFQHQKPMRGGPEGRKPNGD